MMPFAAMEQERLSFLYELYTRSAGDARQGIPYEELIDALGFGEALTKLIQRDLQLEGLIELTTLPRITTVGRPVMDYAPRHRCHQTIGMTPQGGRLMEEIFANRSHTECLQPAASQPS
ncbi:MAG TPA: hypothetical protein VHN13_23740 [Candidatus Tectomicrobia bacterium]|jgi:hypothetical protein|nr:hypothetical protein [Candidatus Tectomicrobia bacterium]